LACRIKAAGENLGWNVTLLDSGALTYPKKKFDWILTLTADCVKKMRRFNSCNYLAIFDPCNHVFSKDFYLSGQFAHYDGYVKTFKGSLSFRGEEVSNVYPMAWYPSAQYRAYREFSPQKLFYFVGQWGDRCHDVKYKTLQRLLSEQDYTCFFGSPEWGTQYASAYRGEISYAAESIQDEIAKMGICLVLHSDIHIRHQIPSGRIFEAAASPSVIISDMNPFVQQHFGDSVLYVDQTASAEEIFRQIDAYVHWILTHPEEAKQMAARSHKIFCEKFLLEQQLLQFDKWHQSVQGRKKKRINH
jgi:hypothetical protein